MRHVTRISKYLFQSAFVLWATPLFSALLLSEWRSASYATTYISRYFYKWGPGRHLSSTNSYQYKQHNINEATTAQYQKDEEEASGPNSGWLLRRRPKQFYHPSSMEEYIQGPLCQPIQATLCKINLPIWNGFLILYEALTHSYFISRKARNCHDKGNFDRFTQIFLWAK